ncbi:MAG: tetratricopeptide repeat protein [Caulobacter sp.]|nr:tetratricopeptide repeat protein [Caulobacter sp.]
MDDVVKAVAPYATVFGAFFSAALLGVLINLAAFARQAERSRADVIEERLKNVLQQLEFTKQDGERAASQLKADNEALKNQLQAALSGSGITLETLAAGASLSTAAEKNQKIIESLIGRLESAAHPQNAMSPQLHLEMSKAYAAQKNWSAAAGHLDAYVGVFADDVEAQFLRAVAHANSRNNDLSALRAYNEVVALEDTLPDGQMRARAFVYRGAMLKRLGRLAEAESDLKIGRQLAKNGSYEFFDASYNLACTYALKGDRAGMLAELGNSKMLKRYKSAIRNHLSDYFWKFKDDEEFLKIIY